MTLIPREISEDRMEQPQESRPRFAFEERRRQERRGGPQPSSGELSPEREPTEPRDSALGPTCRLLSVEARSRSPPFRSEQCHLSTLKPSSTARSLDCCARRWLDMPVIGMEAEFNVWLDEVEINPEPYWKHPSAFIDRPLLKREKTSLQLPTGGAVYFDRGVIEVVTPVIELAPSCTARMVRNLWEQIGFVRDQLTNWGKQDRPHRPPQGVQQPLQHLVRDPEVASRTAHRNDQDAGAAARLHPAGAGDARRRRTGARPASACGRAATASRSPSTSRPIPA